jgi:hypothetical protein
VYTVVDCLERICDNILLRTQTKTGRNGYTLDISDSYLPTCVIIYLCSIGVEGSATKYFMEYAERNEFNRLRKTSFLLYFEEYMYKVMQKFVSHILVDNQNQISIITGFISWMGYRTWFY